MAGVAAFIEKALDGDLAVSDTPVDNYIVHLIYDCPWAVSACPCQVRVHPRHQLLPQQSAASGGQAVVISVGSARTSRMSFAGFQICSASLR